MTTVNSEPTIMMRDLWKAVKNCEENPTEDNWIMVKRMLRTLDETILSISQQEHIERSSKETDPTVSSKQST